MIAVDQPSQTHRGFLQSYFETGTALTQQEIAERNEKNRKFIADMLAKATAKDSSKESSKSVPMGKSLSETKTIEDKNEDEDNEDSDGELPDIQMGDVEDESDEDEDDDEEDNE